MFVDTHTHVYMPDFASPESEVDRAVQQGVGKLILPNVDASTCEPLLALCSRKPGVCYPALGLHPTELGSDFENELDRIEAELKHSHPYVAVGEIGIDLYWDKSQIQEQKKAFSRQFQMACEYGLPVIIHCRKALNEILPLVSPDTKMIFHCFSGNPQEVKMIRRRIPEAYFGIGGVVTFKNSGLRDSLPEIGLNRIVLETDAPYLAPVPHRGKQNSPAYIPIIAAKVAEYLGTTLEEVEKATTCNAMDIFPQIKD